MNPLDSVNADWLIPTKYFLAGAVIVALLVSAYIDLGMKGLALTEYSWGAILGGIIGAAFAMVIVPVLIVLPWRWLHKRGKVSGGADFPIILAAVVQLIVMAAMVNGVRTQLLIVSGQM